ARRQGAQARSADEAGRPGRARAPDVHRVGQSPLHDELSHAQDPRSKIQDPRSKTQGLEFGARDLELGASVSGTLTEQDFRLQADHALEHAQRSLLPLADQDGFEVELQNGVLQVVFEDPSPAKFVVSPNAPVRQVWLSAMSRSYKLAWSPVSSQFELDGETLDALLARLVHQFLEHT